MRTWVEGLGGRQQSIIRRLTKEAVQNHQNIRGLGEGGPAASEGSFAATEAHSVQHQFLNQAQSIPGLGFAASLLMKDEGTKKSNYEYPTVTSTGAPTSYYASMSSEIKTPVHGTGSASTYISSYVCSPAQNQVYRPPSPPRLYGMPSETPQSGYAPSYASSYISRPGPPPGFPGAESARYGKHHTQEGRHKHEFHHHKNEDHDGHGHHHHKGTTPGFPEPGSGGFTPLQGPPLGFPNAESLSYGSYSSQAPRFPEERPSSNNDDSYQYGWRY